MARPLKRDIHISSEMDTGAKRWSVMAKKIHNGHLDGKIRKRLVLGEHYKVLYDTGFLSLHYFTPFYTTFGLAVMGKLLLALVIPYQGTFTKLRYGIGFTLGAFK